jgi:tetratricopeptide (TPR) repeat protein
MRQEVENEGIQAFNNKEYERAIDFFLEDILQNPQRTSSYLYLGKSYVYLDKEEDALTLFKQYHPEDLSQAYDLMGQCYAEYQDYEEALCWYDTAIEINPHCALAHHNKGLIYIAQAEHYLKNNNLKKCADLFEYAKKSLKSALKLSKNDPDLLHSVAHWHESFVDLIVLTIKKECVQENRIMNHFSLAISHYHDALKNCPADNSVLINTINQDLVICYDQFGRYLCDKNDFEKAKNCFEEILKRSKDNEELSATWINKAFCYRQEKNWEEAKKSLQQARALTPHEPDICLDEEEALLQRDMLQILRPEDNPYALFYYIKPGQMGDSQNSLNAGISF